MKKIKGMLLLLSVVSLGTLFAGSGDRPKTALSMQPTKQAVRRLTDDISSSPVEEEETIDERIVDNEMIWDEYYDDVVYPGSGAVFFIVSLKDKDLYQSVELERVQLDNEISKIWDNAVSIRNTGVSLTIGDKKLVYTPYLLNLKNEYFTLFGIMDTTITSGFKMRVKYTMTDGDVVYSEYMEKPAISADTTPHLSESRFLFDSVRYTSSGITAITKSTNSLLSLDEITGKMNFAGCQSCTVFKDEYTGNGNQAGTYRIVYEVEDTTGKHLVPVDIVVRKDLPPVDYYLMNGELYIDSNSLKRLDKTGLTTILESEYLTGNEYSYIYYYDEGNALSAETIESGTYLISAEIQSTDGTKKEVVIHLTINDKDSGVVVDKRQSNWAKFCKFWTNLFDSIKDGCIWLWDHTIGAIIDFANGK